MPESSPAIFEGKSSPGERLKQPDEQGSSPYNFSPNNLARIGKGSKMLQWRVDGCLFQQIPIKYAPLYR
jgi:hypothetical protein